MVKVTIISVFGHRNKGDAAIFRSLFEHLGNALPGARISAVVRQPDTEGNQYPEIRVGEQLLRSRARRKSFKGLNMAWSALACVLWRFWPGLGRRLLPERKRRSLEVMADADLIVSCGGGFLHDGFPGFVVHLFELHMAKGLKKPVLLVSQSIGPFRRRWARWLTRRILDRCEVIMPREPWSLAYLKEELELTRPRMWLIPDLAFDSFEEDPVDAPDETAYLRHLREEHTLVGVTVRQWAFPGRAADARALNSFFREDLARLLAELIETRNVHVVFFPQAITENFSPFDDRAVARSIAQRLHRPENVTLLEDDFPVARLRALMGSCDLFVGTRMHSNIFALSAGVPTLAIAYLPKTRGIMESLGLDNYVVAIDAGVDELREGFERLERDQEQIRSHLGTEIPAIRATIPTVLGMAIADSMPRQDPVDRFIHEDVAEAGR